MCTHCVVYYKSSLILHYLIFSVRYTAAAAMEDVPALSGCCFRWFSLGIGGPGIFFCYTVIPFMLKINDWKQLFAGHFTFRKVKGTCFAKETYRVLLDLLRGGYLLQL